MVRRIEKLIAPMLAISLCMVTTSAEVRTRVIDARDSKWPLHATSRQLLVPGQGGYGIGDGMGGIGLGTGYPGFYGLAGLGPWGAGYGLITDTNPLTGITQGSRVVKFTNVDQPLPQAIKNLMGSPAPMSTSRSALHL